MQFQSTLSVRRATIQELIQLQQFSEFQSTLSVRRATVRDSIEIPLLLNFNPRSPWGERHVNLLITHCMLTISIHALREESDYQFWLSVHFCNRYFNPRSPWGERRFEVVLKYQVAMISIHALREESDYLRSYGLSKIWLISIHALREESDKISDVLCISPIDFNPRSPWGERPFK